MSLFYILGVPLGYVMEFIYKLVPNYGWDIILFTLFVRIVCIPLSVVQQKSTAQMSAYQPLIMEIQTKYKKDPERQQAEMNKLQQDYGYNPMGGCAPMALNFFILFGVIDVVYRPLQRILHISTDLMSTCADILGTSTSNYRLSTQIISAIAEGNTDIINVFSADQLETIREFASRMDFFGIDLTAVPKIPPTVATLPLLIFPLLSLITMVFSTYISTRASGQELQGQMKIMMYMMPLMFVFISFTIPTAFSLYYTVSNIIMIVQSQILRKIYDPDKMKAEVQEKIKNMKKEQRQGVKSKTIRVRDAATGEVTEQVVSANEMNRRRLEYARKLDAEKYAGERTVTLAELAAQQEAAAQAAAAAAAEAAATEERIRAAHAAQNGGEANGAEKE